MKKKILYIMTLIFLGCQAHESTVELNIPEGCECNENYEENECEDFFEISDEDVESIIKEPKKEHWSRARVIAVRLGVSLALSMQSLCCIIKNMCLYLKSLVVS